MKTQTPTDRAAANTEINLRIYNEIPPLIILIMRKILIKRRMDPPNGGTGSNERIICFNYKKIQGFSKAIQKFLRKKVAVDEAQKCSKIKRENSGTSGASLW